MMSNNNSSVSKLEVQLQSKNYLTEVWQSGGTIFEIHSFESRIQLNKTMSHMMEKQL